MAACPAEMNVKDSSGVSLGRLHPFKHLNYICSQKGSLCADRVRLVRPCPITALRVIRLVLLLVLSSPFSQVLSSIPNCGRSGNCRLTGRIRLSGLQEEEEGRVHPVPRFGPHMVTAGEPGRQQQDGHGGCPLAGGYQLRRDPLHTKVPTTGNEIISICDLCMTY